MRAASDAAWPLVSPEGGKEALLADMADFTMGSDHEVYTEGSFRIPAIYLNDWPDRYIHTNFDTPANIDATRLQRAAFIGAASGWYLANLRSEGVPALWEAMKAAMLRRMATMLERRAQLPAGEQVALTRVTLNTERQAFESLSTFAAIPETVRADATSFFPRLDAIAGGLPGPPKLGGDAALVFRRNSQVSGPMSVFGYDWFADHYHGVTPELLSYTGERGAGSEYAYEVLSLVNGRRTASEIRDVVATEYGPVPFDMVLEYLRALETTGAIQR